MTQSAAHLDDAIRRKALKLAKASVVKSIRERGAIVSHTDVAHSARILVDSDPKWLAQAKGKVTKTAKPKRGGW